MTITNKERENAVRRRLKAYGYIVHKDRTQDITSNHQGGYMIVDTRTNSIVRGPEYDYSIEDLEVFAGKLESENEE